ncbi:S8 family serine peptidase [Sorangium sp. So ce1014]|uniref:S8 family serine peptidase n=1 Tax=Sorangium sp. So ce1014 TaxID=3133326 RepID=UPI003F5FC36A
MLKLPCFRWISLACGAIAACSSGDGDRRGDAPSPPRGSTFSPVERPPRLALRLDRVVYDAGDTLSVTLDPGGVDLGPGPLTVALAAPETGDVEFIELVASRAGFASTVPLRVQANGSRALDDGVLSAQPGKLFYAQYFIDKTRAPLDALEEDVVFDFALLADPAAQAPTVDAGVAMGDDEGRAGAKPNGTLLPRGGLPVQIATRELIVYPADGDELEAFLRDTGGSVKATLESEDAGGRDAVLVEVDPGGERASDVTALRALLGEDGPLHASNAGALQIASLAMKLQLDGYLVAVNPRLQLQGAPAISATEERHLTHSMKMAPARGGQVPCVPGDASRPCVENVPSVWAFNALWEKDEARINVAVLDMGFAPTDDVRWPERGDLVACDMTEGLFGGHRCGPGAAWGPPTVGNSFFGARSWHGTGVVATIGAKVNNGIGSAGVAGQVAVPMLYKYDTAAYAFQMGRGVQLAVSQGASVVNISGGYPCRILTNIGPDVDICSPEGRLGICSVVTAGAHAAAVITCAAAGAIPILGPIACAVVAGSAAAATGACVAALSFGDLKGPISTGVRSAARAGVPVVTIAGNTLSRGSLPAVVRDLVDLSDPRTERWGIVPAMIPETIVAGAVGEGLENMEFYGDRVDIWAPVPTAYLAPQSVDDIDSPRVPQRPLGGTSAAAPFITGVIANMQAANPRLNPRSEGMSAAERSGIVARIKEILLSPDNTFSNAELTALGYADQPERRRKLVNPLAAVMAAADVPDVVAMGFSDTSLNYSEILARNDTAETATPLPFGRSISGTLLTLPAAQPMTMAPDVDFYRLQLPASPARPQEVTVTLEMPDATLYGHVTIGRGRLVPVSASSTRRTYRVVAEARERIVFSVGAPTGEDNVYKVTASAPVPARPLGLITRPASAVEVCANEEMTLMAEVLFPGFDSVLVPDARIRWLANGASHGTGRSLTTSFAAGSFHVELLAYDDPAPLNSVLISARTCTDDAPVASIVRPAGDLELDSWDGYDRERSRWFKDVTLVGSTTDTEDGPLGGEGLVWTTDRITEQPAELGVGNSVIARLYSGECFGDTHRITLQAIDSGGNRSAPVTRTVRIWQLC